MSSPLSSQRTGRILLHAMEEVLGEQGLRSVFGAADAVAGGSTGDAPAILWPESEPAPIGSIEASAELMSRLLAAFEKVYGAQSGRGLALRVGRAAFPYALREYGDDLGLMTTGFRLLPLPSKLESFGVALCRLFNEAHDEHVRIDEQDGTLSVHLLHCPLCSGRQAPEALCQLAVGVAEESLYWLSGGKIFQVEETTCTARGDADCTLQIDEAPIS